MPNYLGNSNVSIGNPGGGTVTNSGLIHLRDANNFDSSNAWGADNAIGPSGRTYQNGVTSNFSNYKLTEQHRDFQQSPFFNGSYEGLNFLGSSTLAGKWQANGGTGTSANPPECKMSDYVKPPVGPYVTILNFPNNGSDSATTVLCTAVHKLGYISDDVLKGDNLIYENSFKGTLIYEGYLIFAKYYLYLLTNSSFSRPLIALMVTRWAKYMAYKMKTYHKSNFTGALLTWMGIIHLWPIGLLSKISTNKYYRNTLSALILGITIGPLCLYSSILKRVKGE